MKLDIDHKKGLPIYLQIIDQIRHKVAMGTLAVGDQLPTVRSLAVKLAVNPNTVAKAYTELERDGVLESKQGVGTFIRQCGDVVDKKERTKKLNFLTVSFLDEAYLYGFRPEEILLSVRNSIEDKKQTELYISELNKQSGEGHGKKK